MKKLNDIVDKNFNNIIEIMLGDYQDKLCRSIPPDIFLKNYADNNYYENELIRDLLKIKLKNTEKNKLIIDTIKMIKGIRTDLL